MSVQRGSGVSRIRIKDRANRWGAARKMAPWPVDQGNLTDERPIFAAY
ncbi:hypothetical protein K6W26_18670 [Burkholderia sp. AU42008]|nr:MULTISPECIES: hypothetical protein [unclassified Burkholderia]MBR8235089.1 hypothetical protein [Burkholderia sp. AU32357]MBY4875084.1 hypothetical protein [Burkholderia sp. AU42008]